MDNYTKKNQIGKRKAMMEYMDSGSHNSRFQQSILLKMYEDLPLN